MATPSITMIPSGYKSEKVYSVLPTNGDGDLNFDRNNIGTRVNKNGLIEQLATDIPRLDYSDGSCPSLLLEPERTNIFDYSSDLSAWSKLNSTVSESSVLSLDGVNNSYAYERTSSSESYIYRPVSLSNTTVYTLSFFAKSGTSTNVRTDIWDTLQSVQCQIQVDLATKTVSNFYGTSYKIEDYTNGWMRISVTFTSESSFGTTFNRYFNDGSVGTELYIWGAQLEVGSYATSYIPTSGSPESRGVDLASKDGLSSYISSTEGVLYAEIAALTDEDSVSRIIGLNSGVFIGFLSNGRTYAAINNQPVAYFTPTDPTDFHKVAIKYEDNNTKFFVNGNQIGSTETTQTVSSGLSRLGFDSGHTGSKFYGKVKDLRVYNTALTDLELQTLTTI